MHVNNLNRGIRSLQKLLELDHAAAPEKYYRKNAEACSDTTLAATSRRSAAATLVLAVLLVLGIAVAQSPQAVAERAMRSTATVWVFDDYGEFFGLGSGFVVEPGLVVTSAHVIAGGRDVWVTTANSDFEIRVFAVSHYDSELDVAVLIAPWVLAPVLPLAVEVPSVGDTVFVIGSPSGLEATFSMGVVSGYRVLDGQELLQITAPIAPGSSGGPVLNNVGEVVGIAISGFDGVGNLNFAVPVRQIRAMLERDPEPRLVRSLEPFADNEASPVIADRPAVVHGVDAGAFVFEPVGGRYSFSVRNNLPQSVANVEVVVVFFDADGLPVESVVSSVHSTVLPGLAARVTGAVDTSVRRIVTGSSSGTDVITGIDLIVRSFDVMGE